MKKYMNHKVKLVIAVGISTLFIVTTFACAKPFGVDDDWNYWTNPPNMFSNVTGNVGIGTSSPLAKLHVKGGAVLFSGGTGRTPTSGAGTRLMWIPSKAAFRVGHVSGNQWNNAYIGLFSVAMGNSTKASGYASTAMGSRTTASGKSSTAMGSGGTTASGESSTAMGRARIASGWASTAMGYYTNATGEGSTAMGECTTANGAASTAIGQSIIVNGYGSLGIGLANHYCEVNANNVMSVMGGNVGIGTTNPTSKLDVRGGNVSIDGFPVCTFVGFDYQSADMIGVYSSWTDVPNITVNFSFLTAKCIDLRAVGSAYCSGGIEVFFRFVVDGIPYGNPNNGDCVIGGSQAAFSWNIERIIPLSSGNHTAKLQLRGGQLSMFYTEDGAKMFVFAW